MKVFFGYTFNFIFKYVKLVMIQPDSNQPWYIIYYYLLFFLAQVCLSILWTYVSIYSTDWLKMNLLSSFRVIKCTLELRSCIPVFLIFFLFLRCWMLKFTTHNDSFRTCGRKEHIWENFFVLHIQSGLLWSKPFEYWLSSIWQSVEAVFIFAIH